MTQEQGQEAQDNTSQTPTAIAVDMGYLDQVEARLLSEAAKWKAQRDQFTLNNEASLELVRLAKQALQAQEI